MLLRTIYRDIICNMIYVNSMKGKLIFFIGFIIGFFITLLVFFIRNNNSIINLRSTEGYNDEYNIILGSRKSKKNSTYINGQWLIRNTNTKELEYEKWLSKNSVIVSNFNMDYQHYGRNLTDKINNILLESNWLKEKIHVICIIFVNKIKLAKAIKDTWGPRCNKLYFFGKKLEDNGIPVIKLSMELTSSWQMLCEVMHYVWKIDNKSLQWAIFIKDDTMILLENLRYFIAEFNYNDTFYLGHPIVLWGHSYNVAQAGYVLSRGAFEQVIQIFDNHDKCISGGRYWKKEDFYLGKHLSMLNIYPLDTRDYCMRGLFHGYSLQILLWGIAKSSNYFLSALYPPADDNCCSPKSITFTVAEPDKLYTLNYMFYHLYLYNSEGYYGNRLAPITIPEDDIWKLALKNEFGITNLENITEERYYEIWRSRYSEPSQFIEQKLIHIRTFDWNNTRKNNT